MPFYSVYGTPYYRLNWYEDKISGKNIKRPGLDALKADIFAEKVNTVLIWKLDRLGRTLIAAVLLGVAEKELEHIKEQQASGIAIAKEKGVYKGRKAGTTKASPNGQKNYVERALKSLKLQML